MEGGVPGGPDDLPNLFDLGPDDSHLNHAVSRVADGSTTIAAATALDLGDHEPRYTDAEKRQFLVGIGVAAVFCALGIIALFLWPLTIAGILFIFGWFAVLGLSLMEWSWLIKLGTKWKIAVSIGSTIVAALLIGTGINAVAGLRADPGPKPDLTIKCRDDVRTGISSALYGNLPRTVVFLKPADLIVAIDAPPNEPAQDPRGFLYQIATFFRRCTVFNSGTFAAVDGKLTIRARFWDPAFGRWIGEAKGEISIPTVDPGKSFEFAIANHGQFYSSTRDVEEPGFRGVFGFIATNGFFYSVQDISDSIRYHQPQAAEMTGRLFIPHETATILSEVLLGGPVHKRRFTHFSACHFSGYGKMRDGKLTVQLPAACRPDALKREQGTSPREDLD
ncbi:MAG: hypothetical protein QOF71_2406 [Candidatus Eremiobacteraeota bacterium]|jgi:hypothetical protein|nr:hypothetical protein [Candidatus Eremiobacteraeota bacterium]